MAQYEKMQSRLLALENIPTHDRAGAIGKICFHIIMHCLGDHDKPKENFIGFASDGASDIAGIHNSLVNRLKSELTGVALIKCMPFYSRLFCASLKVSSS